MIENKECTTETQSVCLRCKRRSHLAQAKGATGWILNFGRCKCGDATVADVSDLVQDVRDCATADGDIENGVSEDLQEVTAGEISKEQLPECIDERFDVIETLGKGGMGTVYKVRDRETNSVFALKLLHQNLRSDPSVLKRFEQEARAAEELDHPNLVPTYAHGVTNDGEPYLLIEYVEGETLAQVLERDGALEEDRAISIFEQICAALSYAHESKIVHRDIKPANIILSKTSGGDEVARVVDFGIAKTLSEVDRSTRNLTQTGEVFGSPHYMSPEQCLGLMLDEKSDIYSLGCVMYEVLAGEPPFAGSNPIQLVVKHINDVPKPYLSKFQSSRKARGLQAIARRCLEKDVFYRFQSADELMDALAKVRAGKGVYVDHFKFESYKLEKQLHWAAIALPLVSIAIFLGGLGQGIFSGEASALAYTPLRPWIDAFLIAIVFGGLSFVFGTLARTCILVAGARVPSRKHCWSTLSLVFSSVMCAFVVPTSLYIGFNDYRDCLLWLPLNFWDWVTLFGLLASTMVAIGVIVCCLGYFLDRRRSKVALKEVALQAAMVVSVVILIAGGLGHEAVGNVLARTSYWFSQHPPFLRSGLDVQMANWAKALAPSDRSVNLLCAKVYMAEEFYPEAIVDYTRVIQSGLKFKRNERPIAMRATAYQRLGQFRTALEGLSLAEKENKGYYRENAIRRKVDCFLSLHQPLLALQELDKLESAGQTWTTDSYKRILSLEQLGEYEKAESIFIETRNFSRSSDSPYFLSFGYLYEITGRMNAAKEMFRAAISAETPEFSYPEELDWVSRCIAHLKLGHKTEALKLVKENRGYGKIRSPWFKDELSPLPVSYRELLSEFVLNH